MRKQTILTGAIALAMAVTFPLTSQAQLGGLGKTKAVPSTGGGAATSGADFLKQLTPGAVKFSQAYAKYYEALGQTEKATKMNAAAEQMQSGGTVTKENSAALNDALKDVKGLAGKAELSSEEAKAKWKEGNALYRQGMAEWTVISAAVAMVIKQNPTAAATQPELGMAAGLCVKGLKDMSGYLEIAAAKAGEQKEIAKSER